MQPGETLGLAAKGNQRNEGAMEILVREYNADCQLVATQFVGGVLVDYKITPRE
jgi:hypothetical protein